MKTILTLLAICICGLGMCQKCKVKTIGIIDSAGFPMYWEFSNSSYTDKKGKRQAIPFIDHRKDGLFFCGWSVKELQSMIDSVNRKLYWDGSDTKNFQFIRKGCNCDSLQRLLQEERNDFFNPRNHKPIIDSATGTRRYYTNRKDYSDYEGAGATLPDSQLADSVLRWQPPLNSYEGARGTFGYGNPGDTLPNWDYKIIPVKHRPDFALHLNENWCYEHGVYHRINHAIGEPSGVDNQIKTIKQWDSATASFVQELRKRPVLKLTPAQLAMIEQYGQIKQDTVKVRILVDDGRAYPTQVNAWLFYQEKNVKSFTEIDAVYLEADKKKRITSHVWLFWVYEWKK